MQLSGDKFPSALGSCQLKDLLNCYLQRDSKSKGRLVTDMILAEKISALRKKNGWSQEELAEKLNISRQSVSKWESGGSIPDLDKIIKLSGLFGVSTDYLLKDELEEIVYSEADEEENKDGTMKSVSLEEANTFMDLTRQVAKQIALGVSICIFSPVFLILLAGLQEYGKIGMTEDMAGGLGVCVLLGFVAVGAGILILNGMKLDRYKYMGEENITLQYGVEGIARMKKEAFANTYRICIVVGVICCIISVAPLMLSVGFGAEEFWIICCVPVMLIMIAVGVNLLVWSGTINGSFQKLLQEGDWTEENKYMQRKTSFFPGIYWTLTTALFLGIGFYNNSWKSAWIVWPVAALVFVALRRMIELIIRSKK